MEPIRTSEPTTIELPPQRFDLSVGDITGTVALRRFVLPARDEFSSLEEFERYSGPLKWNRQQGIYIYRARLVQWGGWNGIRGIDEHTKLARASLEFDTDLDSVFNINVAKMRVTSRRRYARCWTGRSTSCAPTPTTDTARRHGIRIRSTRHRWPAACRTAQQIDSARSVAMLAWHSVQPQCKPANTQPSVASSRYCRSGAEVASSLGLDDSHS